MEDSQNSSEVWDDGDAAMNLDIASYLNSADDYNDFERRSVDSLVIFTLKQLQMSTNCT
jgi:hypothetical protein